MPRKTKELVDLTVILVRDEPTDKAILVKETEDAKAVWLPRSQIEYVELPDRVSVVEVTMPLWLANEKGLV